jgi:hypothetical protein
MQGMIAKTKMAKRTGEALGKKVGGWSNLDHLGTGFDLPNASRRCRRVCCRKSSR